MAAVVPNISKGKVAEYAARVNANDPTNSAFVLIAYVSTATLATLKDYDTVAAIEADANTAEATNTDYRRIEVTSLTVAVDDSGDAQTVDMADQTFTGVDAGDNWTHLVIAYDPDTTGGTDSALVPVHIEDFRVTPNGGDITYRVATGGFFRAGE